MGSDADHCAADDHRHGPRCHFFSSCAIRTQSTWPHLPPEDPDDRTAFDSHMAKVMGSPEITNRAVTSDDRLVGTIAAFPLEGVMEVTYWIDRSFWGARSRESCAGFVAARGSREADPSAGRQ